MFQRGRKKDSRRRPAYDGVPEQGNGMPFGQSAAPRPTPRSAPGEPDVDEYMYRSIMGMVSGNSGAPRTQERSAQMGEETSDAAPDSLILRIELPIARAEQLRTLARELDESPQTLARLWVMERLRELAARKASASPSNGDSPQPQTPQFIPELPPAPPEPARTVSDVKKELGDALISDPEERAVYDETYSFRQWGPYIASLVLSSRGRRVFTLEDMRVLLRDELMPSMYDTPGALDSDLVIRDVEIGRPGDQLRPFACLQRVSPGVYSFLGFNRARAMRSGR